MPKVSNKKTDTAKNAVVKNFKEVRKNMTDEKDKLESIVEEFDKQPKINGDEYAPEADLQDGGEADTMNLNETSQTDVENNAEQPEDKGADHAENEVEKPEDDTVSFEENIDDVIDECTGGNESSDETKDDGTHEPWYVARAKRLGDYYNW